MPNERPRTAFVLPSGDRLGALQAGMLRELTRASPAE